MAEATSFCTSQFVGETYFPHLLGDLVDFNNQTNPTKTVVDNIISTVDAQILMALQSAGYYIPLAVIPGETWPDHQTEYLKWLSSLGVAARIFYRLIPNPAANRESENELRKDFNEWIRLIYDPIRRTTGSMLRANYRPGSLVEPNLYGPSGPTTDTLQGSGYYDPGAYASFEQYTEIRRLAEKWIEDNTTQYYEYLKGVTSGVSPNF